MESHSIRRGTSSIRGSQASPNCKKIIKFCELLESRFGLEVVRVDESFTSVEAERLIVKKNISREKKKELLDMLSAQLILQDFFSSNSETGA